MANSETNEKESVLIRVAKYLIPWEGDRPAEVVRKIVFITAAAVLIVALTIFFVNKSTASDDIKDNESLADIFHTAEDPNTVFDLNINTEKREEIKKEYPDVQEKFLPLLEINKDVVGWLTIMDHSTGTPWLDYVVMQYTDNDYYLTHNFRGQYSRSGALFADYKAKIAPDSQSANTIIYGHNMLTSEYFSHLPYYFNYWYRYEDPNDLTFYKNHPTVTFSTLYKTSTYKIFGGMLANTEEKDGEVFRYHTVRNFENKAAFDDYCANILDRSSFINPDVNLKYGDNIITLSTCMFGYDTEDLRWVIFAREVREGESEEVNVDRAYANPGPLYYDHYYATYGGKWEGRKWPLELIQGYEG